MEKIIEYLTERINYLKQIEMEMFHKQYEFPHGHVLRKQYREVSNEFMARRYELEEVVKFLNDQKRQA